MSLYDLRVTVERIEGRSVCGLAVGDPPRQRTGGSEHEIDLVAGRLLIHRLEHGERRPDIVVDRDVNRALDLEIREALPVGARFAGAPVPAAR